MQKAKLTAVALLLSFNSQANDINSFVKQSSTKYNVPENLVHSVIKAESGYNTKAISPVGAGGLMQLMPDTARRFGVSNRFDAKQNIDGGTHYLRVLLDMFDGDTKLAVAGYNAGEGSVIKYGYKIPPYRETQEYVKKVIANVSIQQSFRKEMLTFDKSVKGVKANKKPLNIAAWKALCNFYTPGNCEVVK
jgi:soluble lytic murein transglycosylase-like protein